MAENVTEQAAARYRIVTFADTRPVVHCIAHVRDDGTESLMVDIALAPIQSTSKSLLHAYARMQGWEYADAQKETAKNGR